MIFNARRKAVLKKCLPPRKSQSTGDIELTSCPHSIRTAIRHMNCGDILEEGDYVMGTSKINKLSSGGESKLRLE